MTIIFNGTGLTTVNQASLMALMALIVSAQMQSYPEHFT